MTEDQPATGEPQDSTKRRSSASTTPDGGAFLPIGLVFFIIGLTQLTGDHKASSIVYLVVGAVFMAMSARMNVEKARRGQEADRADGRDAHPDPSASDAPDGQG